MDKHIIQSFREHNNSALPFWYDWRLHVMTNLSLLMFAALFALVFLTKFSIILFVIGLLAWGVMEYGIHRFVLHGKKIDFRPRVEHSVNHHNYFTDEAMEVENKIDLNRVYLMPKDLFAIIMAALIICLPFLFISESVAATLFLTAVIHITTYEIIHGLCHFKVSEKYPRFKPLMQHHTDHHNLGNMNEHNFAIVYPFIDSWFGTRYKRESNV